MIKFFRHIRKSLLMENKTGKYFKYAIGEIVLVIIGILIALQINNWNENRKTNIKVGTYLFALSEEVNNNIERLERTKTYAQNNLKKTLGVLEDLNDDSKNIDSDYMYNSRLNPIYKTELESSVFQDILNSDILGNINDNKLRGQILKISVLLEEYDRLNDNSQESWKEYMLPYFQQHLNVTNLWDSLSVVKMPKLKFKNNLKAFVNNKEFANILALRMRMLANINNRTTEYISQLKELKESLNKNQSHD